MISLCPIALGYGGSVQFGHSGSQQLFAQACECRLLFRIHDLIRRVVILIEYHRIIVVMLLIDFNGFLVIVLLHGS